jgi:hypothetical protein
MRVFGKFIVSIEATFSQGLIQAPSPIGTLSQAGYRARRRFGRRIWSSTGLRAVVTAAERQLMVAGPFKAVKTYGYQRMPLRGKASGPHADLYWHNFTCNAKRNLYNCTHSRQSIGFAPPGTGSHTSSSVFPCRCLPSKTCFSSISASLPFGLAKKK